MSLKPQHNGVVGVFAHIDEMMAALKAAKGEGFEIRDVYSPVPNEEALEFLSPKRSPVRFITFSGGVTGLIAGFSLAILTSLVYGLAVGGKAPEAFVPYFVVGFETTILIGAISTLFALFIFAGLPFIFWPSRGYRPEFSEDRFGVWLGCDAASEQKAIELLKAQGAEKVEAAGAREEEKRDE